MKHKIKKIIAATVAVATLAAGCVGAAGCNYCAHQLEVIEKENSTCIEHGHAYSYKCKKCDKLFAYTTEKGLYEISQAEELPLGDHVASDAFNVRLKEGATSVLDYEVTTTCSVCEAEMVMPDEHLATILAPNLKKEAGSLAQAYVGTYLYGTEASTEKGAGKPYTAITFKAKTKADDIITLNAPTYTKDKEYIDSHKGQGLIYQADGEWDWAHGWGSYQRFPLFIPFREGVERKACYIVKNVTNPDYYSDPIKLSWCIDGKNWADVTVAPGEFGLLNITGTHEDINVINQLVKVSNPNSENGELGNGSARPMKIEIVGVFYTYGSVQKLDIDKMPVKTEYTAGEIFDPTGMEIYATYAVDDKEYYLGKLVDLDKCQFSCGQQPLTKDDNKVTISYGGARVSINITVTEGGAENG